MYVLGGIGIKPDYAEIAPYVSIEGVEKGTHFTAILKYCTPDSQANYDGFVIHPAIITERLLFILYSLTTGFTEIHNLNCSGG